MSAPLTDLLPKLTESLHGVGFPLVGAVDFEKALPLYQEHASRYEAWIKKGNQGEMAYLERGLDRRLNPKLVFPELKSVITVARPYSPHAVEEGGVRYARYLNGPDYHESMKRDIERAFSGVSFQYKICVDTSAVLERTWAALTGLGWIGKNTLLIHPQYGSFLFLATIFTDQEFGLEPVVLKDYCGNCTRCLEACPTKALKAPHELDSRDCISYLTLEKRGSWEKRYDLKGFVAGCDLCQEVCPYNSKAVKYTPPVETAEYLKLDADELLNETKEQYQARVKGTALSRIKYEDFRRNLSASGNSQNGTHKT